MARWLMWDRVRSFAGTNQIFQQERVAQDQYDLERIMQGGDFLDLNQQQAIIDQTNLQINRLERYKDYEQMDQTGEISLSLDLYADEGTLVDPERKRTLIIKAKNKRVKKELEELCFGTLGLDSQNRSMFRYLCKYGDLPLEIIPTKNRDGVGSIKHLNVYNFTRVETRYGDLVGFFYQDELNPIPTFMHPWQVSHMRLTSLENIYHPYGRSILDGGRKAFKQLRLMEDAALIYRITRAPEKRKFKLPVGTIPWKEVPEYLLSMARHFKRRRFYNPTTGTYDERYSPLVQEDDFFLPFRPDGTGPDIEVLPGGENMDKIADIEYFKKKMIAPLKIPFSRVGIGDGAGEAQGQSLSQTHSEFAKNVQWIQRVYAMGITKVCIVHLALRGYTVDDIKGFEIFMAATSAIEELYRIETWQTRAGVMGDLKELGWFPKEWIVTHFTDLTPDEIQELEEITDKEKGEGEEMEVNLGGGGGGLPDLGGGEDELAPEDLGGEEDLGDEDLGSEFDNLGAAEAPEESLSKNDKLIVEFKRAKKLIDNLEDDGHYDRAKQLRMFAEARRDNDRSRQHQLLCEWADKLGRDHAPSKYTPYNGYTLLLENGELGGMSRTRSSFKFDSDGSYSLVDDRGVVLTEDANGREHYELFEWDIPERDDAIAEAYKLMTAVSLMEDENNDEGEITMSDLPTIGY